MPARKSHHLDRRIHAILDDAEGGDDDLLTTTATAQWLGVTEQWLELGRSKNYGPRFTRLAPRIIRYRRGDVLAWLKSRTHKSTAEYPRTKVAAGGAQ